MGGFIFTLKENSDDKIHPNSKLPHGEKPLISYDSINSFSTNYFFERYYIAKFLEQQVGCDILMVDKNKLMFVKHNKNIFMNKLKNF